MDDELTSLYGMLYLDQDVPVQLAGMLRAHGFDVLTTLEAGNLGQSDEQQLDYAIAHGRIVVTHNRIDFESLHAEYTSNERSHKGIIIAIQRRDLRVTRDRIVDLLNRYDRDQLVGNLFYL